MLRSYMVFLAILFTIITTVVALLVSVHDVTAGIILLSILVFTITFSIFIVTLILEEERRARCQWRRYHQHLRTTLHDPEEQEDVHSPYEIISPGGEPPKYEQLYPCKSALSPSGSLQTSSPQVEPTLYVNPCSEFAFSPSSSCPRQNSAEQNEEDGLPSYSEAIATMQLKQSEP